MSLVGHRVLRQPRGAGADIRSPAALVTLPPHLASDLARVRAALYDAPAGVSVLEARESLKRIENALGASWAAQSRFSSLAGYVFRLGVELRGYLKGQPYDRKADDDLLAAMCDAEELAT